MERVNGLVGEPGGGADPQDTALARQDSTAHREPSQAQLPGFVLTVAAPGASEWLDRDLTEAFTTALREASAGVGEIEWLAPRRAFDLFFTGAAENVRSAVEALARSARVDCALQPRLRRRKRLLVADMESTIIRNEMVDELADLVGIGPQVVSITNRAMNGEIDFSESLRERVRLFEGVPLEVLDEAYARLELEAGAQTLLGTLKAHGVYTALVSGGFSHFVRPVHQRLGFDCWRANRLELCDGQLTGRALEPILDRDAKRVALNELCGELACEPEDAAAIGDGANDLAMLGTAGLGVAYHAKSSVAAASRFRIDHGSLETLLFFLGYPESAWRGREA